MLFRSPAVGTPPPSLPATVRQVAAAVRTIGRTMRVEVNAPKGALVHVYRDGQLVTSVTPEEAKSLSIAANGARPEDVQIVVVTRTGDVMSTPVPPSADASVPAGSADPTNAETLTTPIAAPTKTTTSARRSTGNGRATTTTTTIQPMTGSSTSKPGKRFTSDSTKPTPTTSPGK